MPLVKLQQVTVIPGTPEQPFEAASTTCTPPPPVDDSGQPPATGGTPTLVRLVFVPNNPNDPSAGEVPTPMNFDPPGYTCTTGTFFDEGPGGALVPVFQRRCFWNFP